MKAVVSQLFQESQGPFADLRRTGPMRSCAQTIEARPTRMIHLRASERPGIFGSSTTTAFAQITCRARARAEMAMKSANSIGSRQTYIAT